MKHYSRLEFQNTFGYNKGWCDVKIVDLPNDCQMVIATEPIGYEGQYLNEGWSVTNGVEYIAEHLLQLGHRWDFFVEYLPVRGTARVKQLRAAAQGRSVWIDPMFDDQVALVTFKIMGNRTYFHTPQWEHLSRDAFRQRFGFDLQWHRQ